MWLKDAWWVHKYKWCIITNGAVGCTNTNGAVGVRWAQWALGGRSGRSKFWRGVCCTGVRRSRSCSQGEVHEVRCTRDVPARDCVVVAAVVCSRGAVVATRRLLHVCTMGYINRDCREVTAGEQPAPGSGGEGVGSGVSLRSCCASAVIYRQLPAGRRETWHGGRG